MIGPKIYLRILELSDIPTTQKWINDPEMSEIMGYLPVKPLAQQEEWYRSILNDSSRYIFAICLRENQEHIGNIGIGKIDYVHRNGMLSIFIFDKKYRGLGYGSEATAFLLNFAFDRLNMHKVYLQVSPENKKAIEMYEKLGFILEGVMREHTFQAGRYGDKVFYSILRKEFEVSPIRKKNKLKTI